MPAPQFTLVIGNKNYSSWSLRPWLLLKQAGIPFEEVLIPLYEGDYKAKILKYSHHGKVPVLIHGSVTVWETLAIAEYVADLFAQKQLWPQNPEDRALARSISAEMHSGFASLRTHMPMNLRASHPGKGRTPEVEKDIARIVEIWEGCRSKFQAQGPFLFGQFTVADAMYAPVVTRFRTYGVALKGLSAAYAKTILDLPAFKEWEAAGIKEPQYIKASEIYSR
ncbi:MAG: glutathione S-transferase family protein [Candidatus Omnitrophica bacterium]|nr:glutathione S-transferase family protein [Candidatus Omnitrophota bacterium]MDE2214402.1 glutathione S-transferase family protein [Candidatus Omnitrophota bacterium]MDE2231542.1 glutathione S-transferase family protein [Candidatus Omnitrophota bacterium]